MAAPTYTGQDLDGDLCSAVLSRWSQLGATVGNAVPGGLKQEPLDGTPTTQPYATFDVMPSRARADEFHTGGQIQYRDVTVKVRGIVKADVTAAASLIRFHLIRPGTLPMDGVMRLEPSANKIETPAEEKYQQQQVHVGTATVTVWIDHPNEV